jgi:hypothetical protein
MQLCDFVQPRTASSFLPVAVFVAVHITDGKLHTNVRQRHGPQDFTVRVHVVH